MDFSFLDHFIKFLIAYKTLAYGILFLGSMLETVIGFSFFIYGEVFFLAGSMMAGMGILNIWEVIIVLYLGGILGDSLSYFLGVRYGLRIYKKLKKIRLFKRFINEQNYNKGVKFFQRRGAVSLFFARLLGPISWITPFVAGIYKLPYRKFLIYNIPGVIIGIGQFIIIGYFFGKHVDVVLKVVSTYIMIILFLLCCVGVLYYYLKKKKMLHQIKELLAQNKRQAIRYIAKNFFFSSAILLLIYLLFLFLIFFTDMDHEIHPVKHSVHISVDLNQCRSLQLYYKIDKTNIIQPINVILQSPLRLSEIFNQEWDQNKIFDINNISFIEYIKLLKNKIPPISSLYFDGVAQDAAYQFHSDSIEKREHIRIWKYQKAADYLYYASITYDDGFGFNFYNYFYSPIHHVDKDIDRSRDFLYRYLISRKDLNVQCHYIQTRCTIPKIIDDDERDEEQPYYSDGKILFCNVSK